MSRLGSRRHGRSGLRSRLPQLVLAALLMAACWLAGPGIRWASAQSEDGAGGDETTGSSPAGDEAENDTRAADRKAFTDRQIQILRTSKSGDKVELDVAIPATIDQQAPTASDFGVVVDQQLVNNLDVALMSSAVDVVVVIDTSGSMNNGALDRAKTAASSFVDGLPAETRVAVIGFGQRAAVFSDLGLDRGATLAAVDGLVAEGETALWDALDLAAATLTGAADRPEQPAARQQPGYVVLLSDGGETTSRGTQAQSIAGLRAAGAGLYAIAIDSAEADHDALRQTVDAVGGNLALTADTGELDQLYIEIGERLSGRYRVSFPDPSGVAGTERDRKVLVTVNAGETLAMARTVLAGTGTPDDSAPPGQSPDDAGDPAADGELSSDPAGPAQVLNADGTVLGTVAAPSPGLLARPIMLPVGAGAVFLALLIGGAVLFAPSVSINLAPALRTKRSVGWNRRLPEAVERVIQGRDADGNLDRALDAAGISLRPGEFTLLALAVVMVPAMAVWLIGGLLGAVVIAALGGLGVHRYLSAKAGRQRRLFARQLTDTLGIMTGSIRAGHGLPRALELVANEAPDPTAGQFARIVFESRVGRDVTEAMMDVAHRMESKDFEWVTRAVAINRELGGDLTEVLDNVADTIRERQHVARVAKTLSAEGRASGWVLLSMPVLMFLFILWRTPDNAALLFTTGLGRILLAIGVVGMVAGFVWIRKLVAIKY